MYALLGSALVGWQIIKVDGMRSIVVAAVGADEQLGDRIVTLLNRHGLEDVEIPAAIASQWGMPSNPPAL